VSPLTIARIGVGLAAAVKALELWPILGRLAGDPRIVPMPLAPWPRPSAAAAAWLSATWAGLGLCVAAGKAVPVTGTLLAAIVGYVLTLDQQTYSNHLYLLSLVSLLLALAHTGRHREPALALLRWQLVVVYAFAAASKVNFEFLSGSVIASNLRPELAPLAASRVPAALAVAAIATEAFVAGSLLRPKWRLAGVVAGGVMHVGFIVTIAQTVAMIAFAAICLSLYPLYWLPSRHERLDRPHREDVA
jgi:vitamin K-dependent gamma-carboxylase-like protein